VSATINPPKRVAGPTYISFMANSTTNQAKIAKKTFPAKTAGMKTTQLSVDQGAGLAASDIRKGVDSTCCIWIHRLIASTETPKSRARDPGRGWTSRENNKAAR
jgi:hypothetical protein